MGLDFSNPHYRFAYPVSYLQRSEPNARMRHDAVKICNQLGGPRDCKVDLVAIDMVVWTLSSLFQHFYTSRGWDLVADQETILKRTPGEGWYRPGLAAEYGANLTSLVETARQTFPRAKICVQ
eukprot:9492921-Pyramimonas_sp.AAC.1